MLSRSLTRERAALLRSIPLFATCNEKQLTQIDALVDECEVEAGETLTVEGKIGRETFVIASGEAVVTRNGTQLAVLGPGEFFGEMAVLQGRERIATVTARTPMKLLALDPRSFSRLLDEGVIAKKFMTRLTERLRALEE
jgi:CRP-like cAMP-binding protein